MKKIILIGFIILLTGSLFAQENQFRVEYYRTEGKLTSDDKVKEDFGRYDGFNISMKKGEYVNFIAFSEDFVPAFVLINPDGKTVLEKRGSDEGLVAFRTQIDKSGEWIIYLVSNRNATGEYRMEYGFAAEEAMDLPKNANFCETLGFIISHANGYFSFLESDKIPELPSSENASVDVFATLYESNFYLGNFENEAKDIFEKTKEKLDNCLSAWDTKGKQNFRTEEFYSTYINYKENPEEGDGRMVKLIMKEFSDESANFGYSVDVLIGKESSF